MTDSLRALRSARATGAGWGYRPDGSSRVEPTAYALLALAAHGEALPDNALAWLVGAQRVDGSWGSPDGPDAAWVTSLAVLALAATDRAGDACRRGRDWLLAVRSETAPGSAGTGPLSTDASLVGWPWTAGCFGWVEPTAHALAALRATGHRGPRLDDARRFLLDRRCGGGGWNYGAVSVRDVALAPYPGTTAVALVALAVPGGSAALAADVATLAGFLDEPLGAFDLAWIALAMDACEADAAPALARLAKASASSTWSENVHATALAALASALPDGGHPLRLPA
jgi:hypothetical protein